MKFLIAIISLCFTFNVSAQKKVQPIAVSTFTGVSLPAGSTLDKRLISTLSAKVLLELESKKFNVRVTSTEILTLPSVDASNFNADSLVAQLSQLGWNIIPFEDDEKYVWLQKDNRTLVAYLSIDKKNTSLYFGEANQPPQASQSGVNQ